MTEHTHGGKNFLIHVRPTYKNVRVNHPLYQVIRPLQFYPKDFSPPQNCKEGKAFKFCEIQILNNKLKILPKLHRFVKMGNQIQQIY